MEMSTGSVRGATATPNDLCTGRPRSAPAIWSSSIVTAAPTRVGSSASTLMPATAKNKRVAPGGHSTRAAGAGSGPRPRSAPRFRSRSPTPMPRRDGLQRASRITRRPVAAPIARGSAGRRTSAGADRAVGGRGGDVHLADPPRRCHRLIGGHDRIARRWYGRRRCCDGAGRSFGRRAPDVRAGTGRRRRARRCRVRSRPALEARPASSPSCAGRCPSSSCCSSSSTASSAPIDARDGFRSPSPPSWPAMRRACASTASSAGGSLLGARASSRRSC